MNQANRVVVVCGGSSGMGNAVVRLLSGDGFKVYVLDVKETQDAAFIPCDVSRHEVVQRAIKQVVEKEGHPWPVRGGGDPSLRHHRADDPG